MKYQKTRHTSEKNPLKTSTVDKIINPRSKEGERENTSQIMDYNSLCLKNVYHLVFQCPFCFYSSFLMTCQMDHLLWKRLCVQLEFL